MFFQNIQMMFFILSEPWIRLKFLCKICRFQIGRSIHSCRDLLCENSSSLTSIRDSQFHKKTTKIRKSKTGSPVVHATFCNLTCRIASNRDREIQNFLDESTCIRKFNKIKFISLSFWVIIKKFFQIN